MRSSHKNQFDERKNNRVVQTFELRWLQQLDVIQTRTSFPPPLSRRSKMTGALLEVLATFQNITFKLYSGPLHMSPVSEISPYL